MTAVLGHASPQIPTAAEDAPLPLSAQEFERLAAQYPDLRMELSAQGEVTVMAPAHSETGLKNSDLNAQLVVWNKQAKPGFVFDSSSGFTLPSGAIVSPDSAWIASSRWQALTPQARTGFAAIVPDFVMELRSGSDRLSTLQEKMRRYLAAGVDLGWLLDPRLRRVEVYRAGRDVQVLDNPQAVSGEDLLPGFVLDLTETFA